jgi:hypothetical protein
LDGEAEVKEIMIGYNKSPTSFLTRIGKRDNFRVLDACGQEFQVTDNLFTYATTKGAQPVRVKHGLNIGTAKKRIIFPLKDNREKIEVRFADDKMEFGKGATRRY